MFTEPWLVASPVVKLELGLHPTGILASPFVEFKLES